MCKYVCVYVYVNVYVCICKCIWTCICMYIDILVMSSQNSPWATIPPLFTHLSLPPGRVVVPRKAHRIGGERRCREFLHIFQASKRSSKGVWLARKVGNEGSFRDPKENPFLWFHSRYSLRASQGWVNKWINRKTNQETSGVSNCFSESVCETPSFWRWEESPKGKGGTIPVFLEVGKFKRSKILLKRKPTRKGNLPYHLVKPVLFWLKEFWTHNSGHHFWEYQ